MKLARDLMELVLFRIRVVKDCSRGLEGGLQRRGGYDRAIFVSFRGKEL